MNLRGRLSRTASVAYATMAFAGALYAPPAVAWWHHGYGGSVYFGFEPPIYAVPRPYYPAPYYYAPPVYAPPIAAQGCYAPPYSCPLTEPAVVGGPCSCPANRGRIYGRAG